MSTEDDTKRPIDAGQVAVVRHLAAKGSDQEIDEYLHGVAVGGVAGAVGNMIDALDTLDDRRGVVELLHERHPEWFEGDELSIHARLDVVGEAHARAIIRELRESHPEWFA